jgi:hypothetical protein
MIMLQHILQASYTPTPFLELLPVDFSLFPNLKTVMTGRRRFEVCFIDPTDYNEKTEGHTGGSISLRI